jgi:hypothetical protein
MEMEPRMVPMTDVSFSIANVIYRLQENVPDEPKYILSMKASIETLVRFENLFRKELNRRLALPRLGALAAFVQDPQNVHTKEAVALMNDTTDEILATEVEAGTEKKILRQIRAMFMEKRIKDDISLWAKKEPKYLDMLTHTWVKINNSAETIKADLIQRLKEEIAESVGMCAQGHIARLCNVFAGFEEMPVQAMSLQDRMAEISRIDGDTEMKIAEAQRVFDEMKIPEAERTAWLEAF